MPPLLIQPGLHVVALDRYAAEWMSPTELLCLNLRSRFRKRGRGRPPKVSPELMQRTAAEGLRSNHGRQDRIDAQLAIHGIKEMYPEEDDRRGWLFSEERSGTRGPNASQDSNALGPIPRYPAE
jgi:hypothetical protein